MNTANNLPAGSLYHRGELWLVCIDDASGKEVATYQHRAAPAALRRLGSIISCTRSNGRKEYRPLYAVAGRRFYVKAPDGERMSWLELRNRIDLLNCVP